MRIYVVVFVLFSNFVSSQEYPKDFFAPPLEIDLNVTGSFGELRYNHFHSGLDFGSFRKIGIPVLASADGVVNRIQVNEKGFGKALYIKHANGYTTVYAHLNSYADHLQKYVKKNQYEKQNYVIELFPLKDQFLVKKGDVIGFVGNTGSSAGPHLHFEIRDTNSEDIINPFLFGFDRFISDFESPIINAIKVYPLSEMAVVNKEKQPLLLSFNKQKDGTYLTQKVSAKNLIAFAINTYDVMNNKYSKNGIYKMETYLNGSKNFEVIFDRFSFQETRNINVFIDYESLALTKQRFLKLFSNLNYDLNFIKLNKNKGEIFLEPNDAFNYKIIISDYHDNQTIIHVPLVYDAAEPHIKENSKLDLKKIDYKRDYIFSEENGSVEWNALTFFEDCNLDIVFAPNQIQLHKDLIPVAKSITIAFDIRELDIDIDKAFIGLVNKNTISYFYTWKQKDKISVRTRSLGTYKVFQDFDLPVIKPINIIDNNIFLQNDVLLFEVSDDLSGIKTINGYINDRWALFEYDFKTKQITHFLKDDIALKGKNKVTIDVTDNVGNNVIFETNFQMN